MLTSTLSQQSDVAVRYVLRGAGGEIASLEEVIEDLRPGEQLRFDIDSLTDAPGGEVSCEVTAIEPLNPVETSAPPGPNDTCTFVVIDSFGDIQIEVALSNPFGSGARVFVDYALTSSGIRFADGETFGENGFNGAGQVLIAQDTLTEPPAWVADGAITCEILAIQQP